MSLTGIGYNNQNYMQESGINERSEKAVNRNKTGTNTNAGSTDFSIKYVQAGSGNKVYLDPEAIFPVCHAQSGESVNVYRAEDFSEVNPVYILKDKAANASYSEKADYMSMLSELRSDMKTLGNWDGYLRYDKIITDILEYCKNRKMQNGNEAGKMENDEESKTDSEVIVKPDGSRVLVTTTQVGGMEMVMSIKISEPT